MKQEGYGLDIEGFGNFVESDGFAIEGWGLGKKEGFDD